MRSTPDGYAMHVQDHPRTASVTETDYSAPLLTRRIFSQLAAIITGQREASPVPIRVQPSARQRHRRPV